MKQKNFELHRSSGRLKTATQEIKNLEEKNKREAILAVKLSLLAKMKKKTYNTFSDVSTAAIKEKKNTKKIQLQ